MPDGNDEEPEVRTADEGLGESTGPSSAQEDGGAGSVTEGVSLPPIPTGEAAEETLSNPPGHPSPGRASARSARSVTSERSQTTSNRIAAVMSTFKDFDTDMKVGTRQRREKDEFKLHQMREQLALLEKNLGAESKYRAEMHKSVSAWGHEEIERLKEHCDKSREEKKARLDRRFVAIKAKIEEMEIRFAKDMAAIPLDIEQKGAHLAEVLRETVGAVEAEKRDRVERETKIANTLADHEALVSQTFEEHRNARMHIIDDLQVSFGMLLNITWLFVVRRSTKQLSLQFRLVPFVPYWNPLDGELRSLN